MTVNLYYVLTRQRQTYGVAADNVAEARALLRARLDSEGAGDSPARHAAYGTWEVPHGTVLHYGDERQFPFPGGRS